MKLLLKLTTAAVCLLIVHTSHAGNDNHLYPYAFPAETYLAAGLEPDPALIKITDHTGTSVRVTQNATLQSGRMQGFAYASPDGRKIVRAEFVYDVNLGLDALSAGIDVPGQRAFWKANAIGLGQNASIELPGVDRVAFAVTSLKNITIPFKGWFFRVTTLRVYFDAPANDGGIRVSPRMGGAITYLDLDGTNLVDVNDCGRLIQMSLGDGTDTTAECAPLQGNITKWNPTQACDGDICGNYTGAREVWMNGVDRTAELAQAWEVAGSDTRIVSSDLLDWIGGGRRSRFHVEQTTRQTAIPGIYSLDFLVRRTGDTTHSPRVSFELPAVYIRSDRANRFVAYTGGNPWTNEPVTTWVKGTANPFALDSVGRVLPTERWVALVDQNNRGMAVVYPETVFDGIASAGFVLQFNPAGAGSTHYFSANVIHVHVPNQGSFSFRVYLAVGDIDRLRPILRTLTQEDPEPLPKATLVAD